MEPNRIEGTQVFITGATSGIGHACAEHFAEQGARLTVVGRRAERLEDLAAELRERHGTDVLGAPLDVRDREAVGKFVARLEGEDRVPDVLVNNAGLAAGLAPLQEGDPDDWDRMIDTNVTGLLNVTRAVLPLMVARDRGHVVNIGSIAGHQPYPSGNVYNATKFAVRALTEALNMDLLGTAIRVSSVEPGLVETEFSEVRFHGDRERAATVYEGYTPLAPEDIARAVAWVVNAPAHVNVLDLVILPTDQRSAYHVHRENA